VETGGLLVAADLVVDARWRHRSEAATTCRIKAEMGAQQAA
jgi:hypothetical protein